MPASTLKRPCPAIFEPRPRPDGYTGHLPAAASRAAAVLLLAALGTVWPVAASQAATRVTEPAGSAASGEARAASGAHRAVKRQAAPAAPLVDINRASRADLMKLPGIGAAQADAIVAGRPYMTKADLATRKVLPTGVYLSLRRAIVAMPAASPGMPAPGKSGQGKPAAAAPGASGKP
ncbi:MAG: hypothetical protein RLZZ584_3269 [Pseudomonadota bacterium]|jgi:DNA uptake protein ComE-like DNA-binding protein